MDSNENNVCIGFPIRERDKIIPYTFESILNLDYPKECIGLRFVVNDSKDNTFRMCMNFKKRFNDQYRYIAIETINMGTRRDSRRANVRDKTIWVMGRLKNWITDALSLNDKFWLYMDSDIMLKKDTLRLLREADKDVISGWCYTHPTSKSHHNFLKYNRHFQRYDRGYDPDEILSAEEPVRMDLVSGITLMKTWIFKKGRVKFYQSSMHTTSEDEGAVRDMIGMNVERWLHPKAFVYHVMNKQNLDDYIKETGAKGIPFDFSKKEELIQTDDAHLSTRDEAHLAEKERMKDGD